MVDLISHPADGGYPFSYYAKGAIEVEDETLAHHRQYILNVRVSGGQI